MTTLTELSGQAQLLQLKAEHYLTVADAIRDATIALRKVADPDSTISESVSELRSKATEVADNITKAEARYRKTSTALRTYSIALKDAQERAHAAIIAAGEADDNGHARSQQEHYETLAQTPDADQAANQKLFLYWRDKATERATASSNAVSNWQSAHDDKNSAAETAASAIESSYKGSDLNDGFWDKVGNWIMAVGDALKGLCEIAAFLSLFLSWVPILGQVLLVLAVIGALLTLLQTIVKMTRGQAGFWDLMGATLGLVLSVFGGKIFGYLGKLAKVKGISAAMRQGGPIKKLTGLGKGNYLRGAANDLKAAHPFDNPFKLGLGKFTMENLKSGGIKFITNPQKLLGVDKTAFIHGFKPSIIFSSPQMALTYAAITANEVRTVAGKAQTLINIALPDDKEVKLKPF
ncbi:hypothetical protein [Parafrigoribacterium soli]|uniref:hypothetical protein n=1 Tax=Parafrigoribacterium soli TaxID=3144663 RepID=UPI0032EEC683